MRSRLWAAAWLASLGVLANAAAGCSSQTSDATSSGQLTNPPASATMTVEPLPAATAVPAATPGQRPAPLLPGSDDVLSETVVRAGSEVMFSADEGAGGDVLFTIARWNGRSFEDLYDWSFANSGFSGPVSGSTETSDQAGPEYLVEDVEVPILASVEPGTFRICLGNLSCATLEVTAAAPRGERPPVPAPVPDATTDGTNGVVVQCANVDNIVSNTVETSGGGLPTPQLVADAMSYFPVERGANPLLRHLEEIAVQTQDPGSNTVFGLPMEGISDVPTSFGGAFVVSELEDGTFALTRMVVCREFMFGVEPGSGYDEEADG